MTDDQPPRYEYQAAKVFRVSYYEPFDVEEAVAAKANQMARDGWRLLSVDWRYSEYHRERSAALLFEREVGNG